MFACDPATSGETGGVPDFESEIQPILNGCICHQQNADGEMTADYMTLNAGMAYGNIVGVPSEQVPTMNRIEPGSLEDSYLWHKLKGTHESVGGEGTRMPQLAPLDDDKIATVEDWILAGAPQ